MKTPSKKMNILFQFVIAFFTLSLLSGQEKSCDIHNRVRKQSDTIYKSLVKFRRDLHQHPELPGQEIRTANKIRAKLIVLGLEVKSNIGGNGVVGILKGNNEGPVIAWRADIDAFRDDAPDPVEFASRNRGIRHICGHDVHTAIALGIAETLKSIENEIHGTIMFVFQPSEENGTGAKKMIEDGVFSELRPQAIFALHIAPFDAGIISVKPNEMFSRSKDLAVELKGNGDLAQAAVFCKDLIKKTHTITDTINIEDPSILLHPQHGLGNPNGIFGQYLGITNIDIENKMPDRVVVTAHMVGSSEEMCQIAFNNIRSGILNSKWQNKLQSISYPFEHFAVYNDPWLTETAVHIITSTFGDEIIQPLYGVNPYFNDDFAIFQEEIPGVYFLFGGSDFDKGIISYPHFPNFSVDEECIHTGTEVFSMLLFDFLRKEHK